MSVHTKIILVVRLAFCQMIANKRVTNLSKIHFFTYIFKFIYNFFQFSCQLNHSLVSQFTLKGHKPDANNFIVSTLPTPRVCKE